MTTLMVGWTHQRSVRRARTDGPPRGPPSWTGVTVGASTLTPSSPWFVFATSHTPTLARAPAQAGGGGGLLFSSRRRARAIRLPGPPPPAATGPGGFRARRLGGWPLLLLTHLPRPTTSRGPSASCGRRGG